MKRKQYKVYSDGVQYNVNLGSGHFSLPSEKELWFDVRVTSWNDGNGNITGTYEFKNMPERMQRAFDTGILYIGIARKSARAGGAYSNKWWHVDPSTLFRVDGLIGEFSIAKPDMLATSTRASRNSNVDEYYTDAYQVVQLAVVKKTSPSPEINILNKFIPVPNTKHKLYYFE